MAHNHSADAWSSHSNKWASSVQEITRAPGRELLAMVETLQPITKSSRLLDNGAGSGMFTQVILEKHPGTEIVAADVSAGMIETLSKNDWSTVTPLVANAVDLKAAGLQDGTFTHVLGTFFLNFVPNPTKVVVEMQRVATPGGGVVGLSTWSRVSWVDPWERAVRATVDPKYTAPPLFHPKTTELEDVRQLFEAAGLRDVQAKTVECMHPKKESVDAAIEEFMSMGNPSVQLLQKGFSEDDLAKIRPAMCKFYAENHDGVEKAQREIAVLAVGRVP